MTYALAQRRGPPPSFDVSTTPYAGVADSIRGMRQLAQAGQAHPDVRRAAIETVREVYPKDYTSELAALFYRTCQEQRYTRDPINREMIHHPATLLREGASDCDDSATLLESQRRNLPSAPGASPGGRLGPSRVLGQATGLALQAMSIGNMGEFVIVGFEKNAPPGSRYTHVFLRVFDPGSGQWLVLDPVAGPTTRAMISKVQTWKSFPT